MSAEGNWTLATQWATGNTNEVEFAATQPNAAFTLVAPAASGTFLSTFALGSNVLNYAAVAGSHVMRCCNSGQGISYGSGTMGFFWHPLVNPTGGTYTRMGIAAFDDGALNGWALTWRSVTGGADDLKFEMWYTGAATAVTGGLSTTTASTLETFEGVLNPWYFIAIQMDSIQKQVNIRIYKWGNTAGAFPATPTDTISTTVTSGTSTNDIRLGSDSLGTVTGSWQMGNLWCLNGSGIWGPIGCNMASGAADPAVNQHTNSTIWRHSDGVDYPAATTESADIGDYDDADYVQNKSTSSTSTQYHHMANSIVPGTPNILAVQAGCRMKVPTNTSGVTLPRIWLRRGATAIATRLKDSSGTGDPGVVNTWWHNWVCDSVGGGGAAPWVYTDIDGITCGFAGRDAAVSSQELRMSSLYITVAYGADGAAPDTTTRAQTQVV